MIEVPAGALSQDTEITISLENVNDPEPGDLPELASYVFEPDGTTFSKPVKVTLILPLSLLDSGFRLVHAESPGSDGEEAPLTTPLNIDSAVINPDGETVTVTTTIPSFSRIKVYRSGFFDLKLTAPLRAVEGVPFDVQAETVQKTTEPQIVRRQVIGSGDDAVVQTITLQPSQQWSLFGSFIGKTNVSPKFISQAPSETEVIAGTYTAGGWFTCTKADTNFEIEYLSLVDVEETWRFAYSPATWVRYDEKEITRLSVIKKVSGECLAPEVASSTPAGAAPTSSADRAERLGEILFSTPSAPDVGEQSPDGTSASTELANGMTVEARIERWTSTQISTIRRIWLGSVDLLRYTLHFTISGQTPTDERMSVEYQVFSVQPSGLVEWSEVFQESVGYDVGDLQRPVKLASAGEYVVKGTVGDEAFEIAVEVDEPPIRYGILAPPGTWTGQTPLSDEDATELAHFSGDWEGLFLEQWKQGVADGGPVDILKTQSDISLERTDLFIHPIDTGVSQHAYDGSLVDYEMVVPKAYYEGTLTYYLPAFSYEDGNCANETVTYDLLGSVEYAPHEGPWSAPLVLDGLLSGTLPELTDELPTTVQIFAIEASSIDHERMSVDGSAIRIIGPLYEHAALGFQIVFGDIEPNPSSTINDESTCTSSVSNISIWASK